MVTRYAMLLSFLSLLSFFVMDFSCSGHYLSSACSKFGDEISSRVDSSDKFSGEFLIFRPVKILINHTNYKRFEKITHILGDKLNDWIVIPAKIILPQILIGSYSYLYLCYSSNPSLSFIGFLGIILLRYVLVNLNSIILYLKLVIKKKNFVFLVYKRTRDYGIEEKDKNWIKYQIRITPYLSILYNS